MGIKYLRKANIKNKTVFLRLDLNVPIDEKGKVADDYRIVSAMPSIHFLQDNGCKVILCAHLGRPEGKKVKALTLKPVAQRLANLLEYQLEEMSTEPVKSSFKHLVFATGDIKKEKFRESIKQAAENNVVLLENIRFHKEEEENDAFFAKQLAGLADVYVNEAFSVDHHKAASLVAITKYLPSYAGLVLEKEILALDRLLERPKSPFVVMMGGIKISDKEPTLKRLAKKADHVLLAGGLANAFFLAKGYEIGQSAVEKESAKLAFQLEKNFKSKLVLPEDVVVANKSMDKKSARVCLPYQVRSNELILDVGPKTILKFAKIIKQAKTVVWNGPLGRFEHKPFHTGTMSLARIVGAVSSGRAFGVVGGGETVDAIRNAHQEQYIDLLSTGGGAMLEYLAGSKLPGIEALKYWRF